MNIPKIKGKATAKVSIWLFFSLFTFPVSAGAISAIGGTFGILNIRDNTLMRQADTFLNRICESGIVEKISELIHYKISSDTFLGVAIIIGLFSYYITGGMKTGWIASRTAVSFVHNRLKPFMTNPFSDSKNYFSFIFVLFLWSIDIMVALMGFYLFFALAFPLSIIGSLKKCDINIEINAETSEISSPQQKLLDIIDYIKKFIAHNKIK